MSFFENLKSAWFSLVGKAGSPPGSYGVGWGAGPVFSDGFRFRRAPSPADLVENYKAVCYSCVNLNANGVARTPLRLFATTGRGQAHPKCMTKAVSYATKMRLKSLSYAAKAMANAKDVDEVTEHPLLDTVMKVSDDLDFIQLLTYTVMCLDVTGNAYWWPSPGKYGIPDELWALPSHLVFPQFITGQMVPEKYQFGGMLYPKSELIRFRRLSAKNPYGQGYSPLQAAIEYARLESTWVSSQDDMLSNGPRPSVIVSHRDPKGAFGEAERKRLDHDLNSKSRGGRSGAAIIVDGAAAVTPVSWTPTDVGGMQIGMYDLERLANSFDVPVSMLKTEDVNRANADAGLEQHARNAIEPRCKLIASAMTRWTRSLDPRNVKGWDRLFWAFDPAVKEDAKAESELHKTYVDMGVISRNEVRSEIGYKPDPDGDVILVPDNLVPLSHAVEPPAPPEPPTPPGGKPDEAEEDIEDDSADEEEQAEDVEAEDASEESKALDNLHDHIDQALWDVQIKHLKLGQHEEAERLGELLEKAPCRDENGRFASCGGGTGAKPKKPGKKPGKPSRKPATSKPKDPKPEKPKPATKPKPADKPKPASKPKPAEKPPKPTKPPKESAKPAEPKPKPEKPAPKPKPEKPAKPVAEKPRAEPNAQSAERWGKSLTPAETNAVKAYATDTYGVTNGLLRGKSWSEIKADPAIHVPAGMTAAKAKALLKDTKSAISRSQLTEDATLFRGIKDRGRLGIDLDNLKPGSVLTEKGFGSTSLDSGVASQFAGPSQIFNGNVVMRIKAPAGTKGAVLGAAGLETFAGAKEVTLAPGTKYRYVGRSKMKGQFGNVEVMDMEVVL